MYMFVIEPLAGTYFPLDSPSVLFKDKFGETDPRDPGAGKSRNLLKQAASALASYLYLKTTALVVS
jgi:hypothetical protein